MKTRSKNIVIVSLLLIAVILVGAVVFDIVNKRVLTDDTKQEAIGEDDVINEENENKIFEIERTRDHRAMDDAIETWKIFEKLKEMARDTEEYKKHFEPRELIYPAKKQTPATPRQVQRLIEYRKLHQIEDEINWETLTKSEASRIMDRYILVHGR